MSRKQMRPDPSRAAAAFRFGVAGAGLVALNGVLQTWQFTMPGAPPHGDTAFFVRDLVRFLLGVVLFPGIALLMWFSRYALDGRTWDGVKLVQVLTATLGLWFHLDWMFWWTRESHLGFPVWLWILVDTVGLNAAIVLSIPVMAALAFWASARLARERSGMPRG
jgi:hypothetical protein